MNLAGRTIVVDPVLPPGVLIALAVAAALVVGVGLLVRARGSGWRGLAAAVLLLALANPSWQAEEREPIADIGLIVVDESGSQALTERIGEARELLGEVESASRELGGLELRIVRAESRDTAEGEATRLMAALNDAAADVPRQRLAGAVLITDGQVHDTDAAPEGIGPVHVLLTGEKDTRDRRLAVLDAPAYTRVEETATLTVRVEDRPEAAGAAAGETVPLTVRRNGEAVTEAAVPAGEAYELDVPIPTAGRSVIELAVPELDGELSRANNRAAVTVNGVRERLRVLLVSGEPHNGERTWRRLLKADPNVDLVHFTILRPPAKQTDTPIDELSLIAFPIRELFEVKLNDFDLIVFDRYRYRGVLPGNYLLNIADYVRQGGALLSATGPSYAGGQSLYQTPLQDVLPAEPTGEILERGYHPRLTEDGRRHPVTAPLRDSAANAADEDGQDTPAWGRWMRQIAGRPRFGATVMEGVGERPLLLMDDVGEGRVAQLMSDHMWLWTRGFEGGGPQGPLLRRLAHWLMKEPALEADDLTARAEGGTITVTQRRLKGEAGAVTMTGPGGTEAAIEMRQTAPGRWRGAVQAATPGLYRFSDDSHTTVAAVGALNPPELRDLRASGEPLRPVAEASGGLVHWAAAEGVPQIRRNAGRDSYHGSTAGAPWLAWRDNQNYRVTGLRQVPLMPALLVLALGLGALMLAWRREGR